MLAAVPLHPTGRLVASVVDEAARGGAIRVRLAAHRDSRPLGEQEHVPSALRHRPVWEIAPSIDPFSVKNVPIG